MVVGLPVPQVDFVLPVGSDVEQMCNTGILVVVVGVQQQQGDATIEDRSLLVVKVVLIPHTDSRLPEYSDSIVPVGPQYLEVIEEKQFDQSLV